MDMKSSRGYHDAMIHVETLRAGIPIFRALDSEVRIRILELLEEHQNLNMNELAEKLGLSNGALTTHVKLLDSCKLIEVRTATGKHGTQKICSLHEDRLIIDLKTESADRVYDSEIDVGLYSDYEVYPTCGLATKERIVGEWDDPRYFADPERVNAGIVWFTKGFVEYRIPNYLKPDQKPEELQFSFELGSEAPGSCDDWPSDIHFSLNGRMLGYWTSPGDFADARGIFTPSWWDPIWNQYGLLKLLSINAYGTFIDGGKISDVTLDDLGITYKSGLSLRLAVPETARNVGGLTIYGKNFGNYNQGIRTRIRWAQLG